MEPRRSISRSQSGEEYHLSPSRISGSGNNRPTHRATASRDTFADVSEAEVREISVDEHGAVLDTLVSGFAEDRGMRRVTAPPLEQSSREIFGILLDICHRSGAVWGTRDMESVAGWTTPAGRDGRALFAQHAERMTELTAGDPAFAAAEAQFYARHRPRYPVWFLCTIATRPEARGQGLAKAAIRPGLRAADEAGVHAFLETDSPSSVGLYESWGFEVVAQELLDDAVVPTSMIRAPA